MSTARSVDDYIVAGTLENENVLIADYWLEFVAARDVREPAKQQQSEDLHVGMRGFSQRMSLILDNQDKLRAAFGKVPSEPVTQTTPDFSAPPAAENSDVRAGSSPASSTDHPDLSGPFARGKQFVSSCLRDSFVLNVLEKLS